MFKAPGNLIERKYQCTSQLKITLKNFHPLKIRKLANFRQTSTPKTISLQSTLPVSHYLMKCCACNSYWNTLEKFTAHACFIPGAYRAEASTNFWATSTKPSQRIREVSCSSLLEIIENRILCACPLGSLKSVKATLAIVWVTNDNEKETGPSKNFLSNQKRHQ